jgi:hypothetical protein
MQKVYFCGLVRGLRWLNSVVGVYLVQVSLLLFGPQGLGNFFRLEECGNFTPTPEETTNTAVQAARRSISSIQNYTPPVINRNDRNNQLTFLNRRKLALTKKNNIKLFGAPEF